MNRRLSLSVMLLMGTFFVLSVSPPLFAANGGGGHSGGGGHGGGHAAGHASGGSSSGHSFGHSVGHSLGHILGHHSGGRGSHPKENLAGRVYDPAHPLALTLAHIRTRRRMFHRNPFFSTGYCDTLRFTWRDFLFPGDFDCASGPFLFGPFFYGASRNTYFWSDSLANSDNSANPDEPPEAVDNGLATSAEEPGAAVPLPSNAEKPVALLQLMDGSMYGLTRYWLEGTTLHYITTYGGENSIPLERVDFAKTLQINAERGTRLDLTENSQRP
jgi:hypothetical protein